MALWEPSGQSHLSHYKSVFKKTLGVAANSYYPHLFVFSKKLLLLQLAVE